MHGHSQASSTSPDPRSLRIGKLRRGKIGVFQADKKRLPLENRGTVWQNVGFWVWEGLGFISAVNIMRRIAQKLRRIIWLHFGLVSYRIQFRRTQKPCIFMFLDLLDVTTTPQSNIIFIFGGTRILQIIHEKRIIFRKYVLLILKS